MTMRKKAVPKSGSFNTRAMTRPEIRRVGRNPKEKLRILSSFLVRK